MGIRVMVEVLDHWADRGLSRGERDDLLVIAENVNDVSRETHGGIHHDYMCRRAGKASAATWTNAVGKLLKLGVLTYAVRGGVEQTGHRGRVAVYRIPVLCPEPPHDGLHGQCTRSERVTPQMTQYAELGHSAGDPTAPDWVTPQVMHSPGEGHLAGDPMGPKGSPGKWERVTPQVTPTPLSPQKNPPPLSAPIAAIRKFVGLAEEEERECERWITREHSPRGPGWWRSLAENGDLEMIIRAWKAQRTPTPPRIRPSATPEQDAMPEPTPEYHAARHARTARPAEPTRPSHDTAQAVLDALPYAEAVAWRKKAREQLTGAAQADDRAVTVLAAELADQAGPFRNALAALRRELPGLEDAAVLEAAADAAASLLAGASDDDRRRVVAQSCREFADKGINDARRQTIRAAEILADINDFPRGHAA